VNPQFATINYRNNSDSSNYHSLQTQFTIRPASGLTYQATYTWSRSLATSGGVNSGGVSMDCTGLLNRNADYSLQVTHRTHDFRELWRFELPFGPGKWLRDEHAGMAGTAD
jgi:hypothetical protein